MSVVYGPPSKKRRVSVDASAASKSPYERVPTAVANAPTASSAAVAPPTRPHDGHKPDALFEPLVQAVLDAPRDDDQYATCQLVLEYMGPKRRKLFDQVDGTAGGYLMKAAKEGIIELKQERDVTLVRCYVYEGASHGQKSDPASVSIFGLARRADTPTDAVRIAGAGVHRAERLESTGQSASSSSNRVDTSATRERAAVSGPHVSGLLEAAITSTTGTSTIRPIKGLAALHAAKSDTLDMRAVGMDLDAPRLSKSAVSAASNASKSTNSLLANMGLAERGADKSDRWNIPIAQEDWFLYVELAQVLEKMAPNGEYRMLTALGSELAKNHPKLRQRLPGKLSDVVAKAAAAGVIERKNLNDGGGGQLRAKPGWSPLIPQPPSERKRARSNSNAEAPARTRSASTAAASNAGPAPIAYTANEEILLNWGCANLRAKSPGRLQAHQQLNELVAFRESLNTAALPSFGITADPPAGSFAHGLIYAPYLPQNTIQCLVEDRAIFVGRLQVDQDRPDDAYVFSESFNATIFVAGSIDRNRALHGDTVAVRLLDLPLAWSSIVAELTSQWEVQQKRDHLVTHVEAALNSSSRYQGTSHVSQSRPSHAGFVVALMSREPNQVYDYGLWTGRPKEGDKKKAVIKTLFAHPIDARLPLATIPLAATPPGFVEDPASFQSRVSKVSLQKWPITSKCPTAMISSVDAMSTTHVRDDEMRLAGANQGRTSHEADVRSVISPAVALSNLRATSLASQVRTIMSERPSLPATPQPIATSSSGAIPPGFALLVGVLRNAQKRMAPGAFFPETRALTEMGSARTPALYDAGVLTSEAYLQRAAALRLIERKTGGIRLFEQSAVPVTSNVRPLSSNDASAALARVKAPIAPAPVKAPAERFGALLAILRAAQVGLTASDLLIKAGSQASAMMSEEEGVEDWHGYLRSAVIAGVLKHLNNRTYVPSSNLVGGSRRPARNAVRPSQHTSM